MRRQNRIWIGTSGWQYKHWKGTFYPETLKAREQFPYYCSRFTTVELNNSFYRLPSKESYDKWKAGSPRNFVFAVKGSRYLTHMKKLKADAKSIRLFFSRATRLENKLGVVLFQLPPGWKVNTERLRAFITRLPQGIRYAFEFREHSWYREDVYDILRENNCAFCIYELEHHLSPMEITADFVYVRLHGPGGKYQGKYTDSVLKKWASRCKAWVGKGMTVFFYFDNDQEGYAAENALRLRQLVEGNKV